MVMALPRRRRRRPPGDLAVLRRAAAGRRHRQGGGRGARGFPPRHRDLAGRRAAVRRGPARALADQLGGQSRFRPRPACSPVRAQPGAARPVVGDRRPRAVCAGHPPRSAGAYLHDCREHLLPRCGVLACPGPAGAEPVAHARPAHVRLQRPSRSSSSSSSRSSRTAPQPSSTCACSTSKRSKDAAASAGMSAI